MLKYDGMSFTVDATGGLGISLAGGDSEFTIGASFGPDFMIERNATEIVESISLTDDEADIVNSKSSGNQCWGLTNKKELENGIFEANVTIDVGDHKKTTAIKVYSSDNQVWMSTGYKIKAMEAEKEDRK